MDFTPRVYFVTPVWRRFALADACLRQRREFLDALPFEAHQVIIGDEDNHKALAEELGFEWVTHDNVWVSEKFNAGYRRAAKRGATHMMPIGSDSFIHPDAFLGIDWHPRHAYGLLGLSSMSPYGDERCDFQVKYPAGFGVGMVYPAWAIHAGGGAGRKNKGIDSSTWARCGRGRVQIEFLESRPFSYVNFHSPADSITDYSSIRGTYARKGRTTREPWADLEAKYGREHVERVQGVYAGHALGVFLTGQRPVKEEWINRRLPGHKGRDPRRRLDGSLRGRSVQAFEDLQNR